MNEALTPSSVLLPCLPGYQPCDPQVIQDRVSHLEQCFEELSNMAAGRKAQLEQSKRLWKFFWEMDEAESWIKEKEQIYSSLDYGKDLTSVLILQRKHKAFEDELRGLDTHLDQIFQEAEDMVARKQFGHPQIEARIKEVSAQWDQLKELAAFRKKNLQDAENFFQFQGDADDLKAWLQDAHKLLSGEDVGQDEGATRALGKKHKDFLEELEESRAVMEHLERQAQGFPQEFRDSPDVTNRLQALRDLYQQVVAQADLRRQKLQEALDLYTVFGETDACELWMGEKEKWLAQMEIPDTLEDLEVVQHRSGPGLSSCLPTSSHQGMHSPSAGVGGKQPLISQHLSMRPGDALHCRSRAPESQVPIGLCGFGCFTPAAFLNTNKGTHSSPVTQLLFSYSSLCSSELYTEPLTCNAEESRADWLRGLRGWGPPALAQRSHRDQLANHWSARPLPLPVFRFRGTPAWRPACVHPCILVQNPGSGGGRGAPLKHAEAGGTWALVPEESAFILHGSPPPSSCPFSYPGPGYLAGEYLSGQGVKAVELESKSSNWGSGGRWSLGVLTSHHSFSPVPLC